MRPPPPAAPGLTGRPPAGNNSQRSRTIRIGVICGGQSAEHEISLRSAWAVAAALDDDHEVVLIYIQRDGTWRLADSRQFIATAAGSQVAPPALSTGPLTVAAGAVRNPPSARPGEPPAANRGVGRLVDLATGAALVPLDVVFPVLHGPFGEDGTMQGLLELAGVPYVGAGVLGSAVAMDKEVAKRLLRDAGIASARFSTVRQPLTASAAAQICAQLGLPLFVKPANMGSSVGISKVTACGDLPAAVAAALRYDHKVLVEECIDGRELEVSVLGNDRRSASLAGEIVTTGGHEFYSYEAKYLDADGAELLIPAPLADHEQRRVRDLACRACAVLEVQGMARVDFFLRCAAPGGQAKLLVNEVNTIPGFTEISMYAKLWEASGVPFPELLRRLLDLALERHRGRVGGPPTIGSNATEDSDGVR